MSCRFFYKYSHLASGGSVGIMARINSQAEQRKGSSVSRLTPPQASQKLKNPPVPAPIPKIHINKKRLALLTLGGVATAVALVYLAASLVSWLWGPPASPFAGLVPSGAPLVAEGTPQEISKFLKERCGLLVDFKSPATQKDELRALFAVFADGKLSSDPRCQAYLLELSANIEELWNKNSSYPTSVSPFPPCPHGGQVAYHSDGENFTLVCQGGKHRTAYSSDTGLTLPGLQSTETQAASKLSERAQRVSAGTLAQERLSELQDSPLIVQALMSTDLSAAMTPPSSKETPAEGLDLYENVLTSTGKQAAQLIAMNRPLAIRDLPTTFAIRGPFMVAIANAKEDLPGCFRLDKFPKLQIWASDPARVRDLLSRESVESVDLASPQDASLQLVCQGSAFEELFPGLTVQLPQEACLYLQKLSNSQKETSYTGRIDFPAAYSDQLGNIAAQNFKVRETLKALTPRPAALSINNELATLFNLNNTQILPIQSTTITMDSISSDFGDYVTALAQAERGRLEADLCLKFEKPGQAEDWLKRSPWASGTDSAYTKLKVADETLQITPTTKAASCSIPTLPEGVSPTQACGWLTLKNEVYSFAMGVEPIEAKTTETIPALWFKINSSPITNK